MVRKDLRLNMLKGKTGEQNIVQQGYETERVGLNRRKDVKNVAKGQWGNGKKGEKGYERGAGGGRKREKTGEHRMNVE